MCELTVAQTMTLPMDTSAPRLARHFLDEAACAGHNAEVLEEAKLLVSELVANAVNHGSPPITMKVECDGTRGLKVSICDGSSLPVEPRAADPLDESGRGLMLVDLMSSEWGVEEAPHGKSVWFSIRSHNPEASYVN